MNNEELVLPGVDLNDARRRLVDDLPFLLSLLREFVRHSIAMERSLVLDCDPAGIAEDLRKLHQLRGGAGNLAVQSVEGVSARMELALRSCSTDPNPREIVRATLVGLRSKLRTDLCALRDALQSASVGVAESQRERPRATTQANTPAPRSYTARILIIDDSRAMRSYLKAILEAHEEPFEIIEAPDGLKGFQCLTEARPDVVLCDLQMPNFDGVRLLSLRSNHPELLEIPVIMITAEHQMEKKVELLERGAADYVTKPFHARELLARVKLHLNVRRLREEVKRLRGLVDAGTATDDLTGVLNRRHFEKVLLEEADRTTRYGVPLALILLQLGRLPASAGDGGGTTMEKTLTDTGLFLSDAVRQTDKVARIALDKFAIVLPHTGRSGAKEMANRLSLSLGGSSSPRKDLRSLFPASFGIASSEGTPITAKEMLNRADAALGEAARSGGAKVVEWTPAMHPAVACVEI